MKRRSLPFVCLLVSCNWCQWTGLTVKCERGGAGCRTAAVGGHAGVLALVLRIHPGDLQLAAVLKLRHPEEFGLLDLLLLVEPADFHIWSEDRKQFEHH